MTERIYWVDYAKTIGIFLVILAHTPLLESANIFIYVFHMPLFFFISGYLFSFDKHPTFKAFITRRFKQLIIPYFFFNVATYIFWFFVGRKFGNDASLEIKWFEPILGMFYAKGSAPWLIHCIPLWFISCLFVVELIYYVTFKNFKKWVLFPCFMLIGYIDYLYDPVRLPWNINIALVAIVFYSLGNHLKPYFTASNPKTGFTIRLIILSFSVVYVIAVLNGKIGMHTHNYGNFFLFMIGAISGITGIFLISFTLQRFLGEVRLIQFISQNTLTILGLHLSIASIIKGFSYFILNQPLSIYTNTFWLNVIFSLFSLLILLPIAYFFNKHTPILIGK